MEGNDDYISRMLLLAFLEKKDWTGLKAALPKINFTSNDVKASNYNSIAWEMQKKWWRPGFGGRAFAICSGMDQKGNDKPLR